ncbi:Fe(3+)-hydroxamate ABC transporter permease FhuB [Phyllobacterium phragmitis]|uniref:Fe(3+)-hydroxamate ABC transporter permease FhuB n=1 Tax=Phyllobacterium phragmitis TaxID=2670329 RepID=A0A2S9IKE2_9HYPH|nr:Fe(3+)-hydroxamate ABC transporter permease FhuB [Phyllobacterium phragmitis]PRD41001.1 Fe(3+)-hydroxamate ABC transporter permease FhuB [Phyllobacterium phragmitis]
MASNHSARGAVLFSLSMFLPALLGMLLLVLWQVPAERLYAALFAPDVADIGELRVHYSLLPRLAVCLASGAALGLAGAVLQQVLQNPLASPSTLGISAGAQLALSAAIIFFPGLIGWSRDAVALGGGMVAVLLVFAFSWRQQFAPFTVILSGLIIGLMFAAISAALVLHNERYLAGLFLWGSGVLKQYDWETASALLPRLGVLTLLVVLMMRPLIVLGLEDGAAALGVNVLAVRAAGLILATALAGAVTAQVGIIGFIGLAAPALARSLGADHFKRQLFWSPVFGAALLLITDVTVQLLDATVNIALPTGAVTALLGAPVLLWLLPRLRMINKPALSSPTARPQRVGNPALLLSVLFVLALAAIWISLCFGRAPDGSWQFVRGEMFQTLLPWRLPRVTAAFAAGAMLAVAGVILQRFTGNAMASPEILGVSSGAGLGIVAALFLFSAPSYAVLTGAAALGSLFVLTLLLGIVASGRTSPNQILLAGVALGALLSSLFAILMATGDPRMMQLFTWMMGSTYGVTPATAAGAGVCAVIVMGLMPLFSRWLNVLPLGQDTARELGIDLKLSTLTLLGFAALATAAATLVAGPLTFVGLMAPHLARQCGLARALPQMAGAALSGGMMMLFADWLGRVVDFPWQLPSGLVATLITSPLLLWLLSRR